MPASHGHRRGQLLRTGFVGGHDGPGAAEQPPCGVTDRLDHGLLSQAAVGLQGDLEQSFHPAPVMQRREPGADEVALQDQPRNGQGQRPKTGLDGQRQDRASQGPRTSEGHLEGQMRVNSPQGVPMECTIPATRTVLTMK